MIIRRISGSEIVVRFPINAVVDVARRAPADFEGRAYYWSWGAATARRLLTSFEIIFWANSPRIADRIEQRLASPHPTAMQAIFAEAVGAKVTPDDGSFVRMNWNRTWTYPPTTHDAVVAAAIVGPVIFAVVDEAKAEALGRSAVAEMRDLRAFPTKFFVEGKRMWSIEYDYVRRAWVAEEQVDDKRVASAAFASFWTAADAVRRRWNGDSVDLFDDVVATRPDVRFA